MSTSAKCIFGTARQITGNFRKLALSQQNNVRSIPWFCVQCSHRRLLSTASKTDLSPLKKGIGHQSSRQVHQARPFSSSSCRLDDEKYRNDLPSAEEGRRSHASKRFDDLMDNIQSNIFIAGQRLNDLTGYSGIEALRKEIEQQEQFVQATRTSLQRAREAYTKAISQRSTSQREVNELLQRKHAWSTTDLERFTELYRSDHANEQAESAAQQELANVEKTAEEAAAHLSKSILSRYHEEQIWSDKIRRMSTWGTWGLMGVNVLLFLIFQIGVEPWRRRRLVQGFEEKVMEALEREGQPGSKIQGSLAAGGNAVAATNVVNMAPEEQPEVQSTSSAALQTDSFDSTVELEEKNEVEPVAITSTNGLGFSTTPEQIIDLVIRRISKLFSDRQIAMTQRDVTAVAIEGAAAGMVLTGALFLLLHPR